MEQPPSPGVIEERAVEQSR